jgi:Tol biopolymer transport system component
LGKINIEKEELKMKTKKLIISLVIVCLLMTMVIPMAAAPKPPGKPGGGGKDKTPADPAITFSGGMDFKKLYVMDMDGSNKALIHDAKSTIHSSTWSPDGSQIAFELGFRDELRVVDVGMVDGKPQGSNARLLRSNVHSTKPAWSPLGDEIAIAANPLPSGATTEIHLISAADGSLNEKLYVASEGWAVQNPAWSPDASEIAFVLHETTGTGASWNYNIVIIDVNTKVVTSTSVSGWYQIASSSHLDWAHTQNTLVFYGSPVDRDTFRIYTFDMDSDVVTQVLDGRVSAPSWSYDDGTIIYGLRSSGKFEIMTLDLGTSTSTRIMRGGVWAEGRPPSETWPN